MPEYLVRWEIDITADNEVDAARHARAAQTREDTIATVFQVQRTDKHARPRTVDLTEGTIDGEEF